MKRRTLITTGLALGAGTVLALSGTLPAHAHVTVSASSTAAGSYSVLSFAVPHGCEGSPTTVVEIGLPEEIVAATPTVVAGWDATKVVEELAAPHADAHEGEASERVTSVVYTSTTGGLPEGYRQEFDVQVRLPELKPGTELGFPVKQTCVDGEELWDGDDRPTVTLTAATGDAHGAETAASGAEEAVADDAEVDVIARSFGVLGVAVGAVGLVYAVIAHRRTRAGS